MTEDARAVLEGIAFGDDPKITPADRLKPLEQLQQLRGGAPEARAREIADAARIDAEFAARAEARAEELYRPRAFRAVEAAPAPPTARKPPSRCLGQNQRSRSPSAVATEAYTGGFGPAVAAAGAYPAPRRPAATAYAPRRRG